MPIGLLYFGEGVEIKNFRHPKNEIAKLLLRHWGEIRVLPEGEYDLTPKHWTQNTHVHALTVLANGNGVYRLIPKDKNVGLSGVSGEFVPGGKTVLLPQDQNIVLLGGPTKERTALGAYAIIFYLKDYPKQA